MIVVFLGLLLVGLVLAARETCPHCTRAYPDCYCGFPRDGRTPPAQVDPLRPRPNCRHCVSLRRGRA